MLHRAAFQRLIIYFSFLLSKSLLWFVISAFLAHEIFVP